MDNTSPDQLKQDPFTRAAIEERARKVIAEHLAVKPEQITSDASFIHDLNADSLDVAELVIALEEEFELEIDDATAETLDTLKAAVDYIMDHKSE